MNSIVFIDTEVHTDTKKIIDFGAIKNNNCEFHSNNIKSFKDFISNCNYICGHNIIKFDLSFINNNITLNKDIHIIDTLPLSPLLFPEKPYHRLVKNDKLYSIELNNPLNDSKNVKDLFYDEINSFNSLCEELKNIYYFLLHDKKEFCDFFKFIRYTNTIDVDEKYIKNFFKNYICDNANLNKFIIENPIDFAYSLAIINTNKLENKSLTPKWVLEEYHNVEYIIKQLCGTPCDNNNCSFCSEKLNLHKQLNNFFNFKDFRTYEGEKLQEKACNAAIHNKSLIAVFPTGGGKSLTFQLPALIAAKRYKGLTIVISPLQSLMKDQIDNLEKKNIVEAVTINGLLTSIERKEAIERIIDGRASILYISPEQLRSRKIEHILLHRNVVRFVIDEAHCFSAWGQDFRVDYLYIGPFIKKLQGTKNKNNNIAVSCFTATAKPKVISDIKEYFKNELNIELELFTTTATRKNLHYSVKFKNNEEEKYKELRSIIESKDCPTIVYVQSVKKTKELATKLTEDGHPALPYNGKMDIQEKKENQDKFISNQTKIMVATSAFGMGVDKPDIELIIHYEVSSSLEDYMQESGRAAREEYLKADCYVLFSTDDTDKHFEMLKQNKLSMNEIQQVWKAIKNLTKNNNSFSKSSLEIAREAGWNSQEVFHDAIEIKIKTALLALEKARYIKREENIPRIYATSINVRSTIEAIDKIRESKLFDEEQTVLAKRIIMKLISCKRTYKLKDIDAESRVDWIADLLAIKKEKVIEILNLLRQINILADEQDITATINNISGTNIKKLSKIEDYLINNILNEPKKIISLKEINKNCEDNNIKSDIKILKTILNYWRELSYIKTENFFSDTKMDIVLQKTAEDLLKLKEKKFVLCKFIIDYIETLSEVQQNNNNKKIVNFSIIGIFKKYNEESFLFKDEITIKDIEKALLYLHKTNMLSLEGGFLVSYTSMKIQRIEEDTRRRYLIEDYRFLDDYYKHKIQQINIIDKLLHILVANYEKAIEFIKDYFTIDYELFVKKYFNNDKQSINLKITKKRNDKIFNSLSDTQKQIIHDDKSQYIIVAAGPGSGKTKVLVHKIAALLTLEEAKTEQFLMLTLSKLAALEFKKRLIDLINGTAYRVDIKTFHSYAFDLLGHPGSQKDSKDIIKKALDLIQSGEAEESKITKTILVLDEAQDMSEEEFNLIKELIKNNEDMKIIAVGDDDQNIFKFRGSDSKYFQYLLNYENSKKYEMLENYRSCENIVNFSNIFVKEISNRMKENMCISHKTGGGVNLIKYSTENIEEPIVNKIVKDNPIGTTCIIVEENEIASKLLLLLLNRNIPAKLIQTLDSFKLTNLYEIKIFIDFIKSKGEITKISKELWKQAKEELIKNFKRSKLLDIVLNSLKTFEKVNEQKYLSDLEDFFEESKLENFYEDNKDFITISTIHKAKGREYDNVYLLVKNSKNIYNDDRKRNLYVGFTRAKQSLNIFYNENILDKFKNIKNVNYSYDTNQYAKTKQIILTTSLKDVYLSYFKENKDIILTLRSGDRLDIKDDFLYFNNKQIVILSKNFRKRLDSFYNQGYILKQATIQFIVFWKDIIDNTEIPIILPELLLESKQ